MTVTRGLAVAFMIVTIAAAVPRGEKFAELREAGNPGSKQEVPARRSADNVTVAGNTTGSNVTKPDNETKPDNVHKGRVLKEVKFEGGKAGTSSLVSTYHGRKPDNAFVDNESTCDRSGKPFPGGKFGMKYCTVDEKMKASYRCLGIRVLNVAGSGPAVQIRLIRMWANVSS